MKSLITQNHIFKIVIEEDSPHGYHIWCPSLPGCHSQGNTIEEARKNIIEAIEGYMESLIANKKSLPKIRQKEIWVEHFNIPMPEKFKLPV